MAREKKQEQPDMEDLILASEEYTIEQIRRSRWLRDNMTKLEKTMWSILGKEENQWGFVRQIPVGPYYLDFWAPSLGLCIEVDGPDHLKRLKEDSERDEYLKKEQDIITLRIKPGDFVRNQRSDIYDWITRWAENAWGPEGYSPRIDREIPQKGSGEDEEGEEE